MVDFLNDTALFKGDVTTQGELIAKGVLTVGSGGMRTGQPASEVTNSWPVMVRVRVANVTERAAVVAWRAANDPITAVRPLLVWRADGSLTGLEESTIDGVNWYAESASAGDIEMTLATVAPYGWALMQGQLLVNAATVYPALWANVTASLRSGNNLLIPDMRGRGPIGAGLGTGLTLRNLGDLLGDEAVALTVAQLAAHSHTGTTGGADRSLNHTHRTTFNHVLGVNPTGSEVSFETHNAFGSQDHESGTIYSRSDPLTSTSLSHLHPFTTAAAGTGQAHPNMQPSVVVNFRVKL